MFPEFITMFKQELIHVTYSNRFLKETLMFMQESVCFVYPFIDRKGLQGFFYWSQWLCTSNENHFSLKIKPFFSTQISASIYNPLETRTLNRIINIYKGLNMVLLCVCVCFVLCFM